MDERFQYLNSQLAQLRGMEVVTAYMDMESMIDNLFGVPTLILGNDKRHLMLQIVSDDEGNCGGSFYLEDEDVTGRCAYVPHRLAKVMLGEKTYFIDDRLRELRNINDPCDTISFG